MMKEKKGPPIVLSVVMPAYNEETNIAAVIDEHVAVLRSLAGAIFDWEIVCLDDASTDKTEAVLHAVAKRIRKLRVITHEVNKGIFASFTDVQNAAEGTHIYSTASDGQWPATNIIGMLNTIKTDGSDLVVAVRTNRREVYGLWRLFVSAGFNLLPRILFGIKTEDAGSVKLGRREVFQLDLISHSPFGEAERIIRANREGYRVSYYPIQFTPRLAGKMSGAKLTNVFGALRDCIRCVIAYGLGQR